MYCTGGRGQVKTVDQWYDYCFTITTSHPQISRQITGDKFEIIKKTGVKTVAMDCPGCILMLKGAMGKADDSVRCAHTVELLAEAIEKKEK